MASCNYDKYDCMAHIPHKNINADNNEDNIFHYHYTYELSTYTYNNMARYKTRGTHVTMWRFRSSLSIEAYPAKTMFPNAQAILSDKAKVDLYLDPVSSVTRMTTKYLIQVLLRVCFA